MFSPVHRQLIAEAQGQLREAEQHLGALLSGQDNLATFEAACDALNVAAVKLRFVQIELSVQAVAETANLAVAAERDSTDDTLSPD